MDIKALLCRNWGLLGKTLSGFQTALWGQLGLNEFCSTFFCPKNGKYKQDQLRRDQTIHALPKAGEPWRTDWSWARGPWNSTESTLVIPVMLLYSLLGGVLKTSYLKTKSKSEPENKQTCELLWEWPRQLSNLTSLERVSRLNHRELWSAFLEAPYHLCMWVITRCCHHSYQDPTEQPPLLGFLLSPRFWHGWEVSLEWIYWTSFEGKTTAGRYLGDKPCKDQRSGSRGEGRSHNEGRMVLSSACCL